MWGSRGPHLAVPVAPLLQHVERVVRALPFAVELHPPRQPVVLDLGGHGGTQGDTGACGGLRTPRRLRFPLPPQKKTNTFGDPKRDWEDWEGLEIPQGHFGVLQEGFGDCQKIPRPPGGFWGPQEPSGILQGLFGVHQVGFGVPQEDFGVPKNLLRSCKTVSGPPGCSRTALGGFRVLLKPLRTLRRFLGFFRKVLVVTQEVFGVPKNLLSSSRTILEPPGCSRRVLVSPAGIWDAPLPRVVVSPRGVLTMRR